MSLVRRDGWSFTLNRHSGLQVESGDGHEAEPDERGDEQGSPKRSVE